MESGTIADPRLTAHPKAVDAGIAHDHPRSEQRTIGLLFGGTGVALVLLMGVLGLLMRLDQARAIDVGAGFFYRAMTLHGAGMIAATLLAMMGGIWFAVRGTVPLSFGRAITAYALVVGGAVAALVGVLAGGFATGWTFLAPLPFFAAGEWSDWATIAYVGGIALLAIGFMIFCVDMVTKIIRSYGGFSRAIGFEYLRDRDDDPPSPPVLAALVVGIQGILVTGGGVALLVALLTRTFDEQMTISALWAKELTYSYGHTLANLIIYLAAGFLYMIVPRYAGRPWKTSKPIVIGWMATLVIVLSAYTHHLYMDFAQPVWASAIGMIASSAAAVPVAVVTIYSGMMLVWGSRYRWTLASTLLYLGFAGWAIGGTGAVIDSLIPANFRLHNTLWVPAHFHTYMMLGVTLWALSLTTYLCERAARETSRRAVTTAAPALILTGGYGLVLVWFVSGALGVPRRYADHFGGVDSYSVVAAIAAFVFATGVLAVVAENFRLGRRAVKRAGFRRAFIAAGDASDEALAPEPGGALELAPVTPMLATRRQLVFCVAALTASLWPFLPAINDAVDADPSLHHLQHGGQFAYGMLLAVALANTPTLLRHWRGQSTALAAVIVLPAVLFVIMAPSIYTNLEDSSVLHSGYHLAVVAIGAVTGYALTAFDRFTAWLLFFMSASMGFLYAAGVGLVQ